MSKIPDLTIKKLKEKFDNVDESFFYTPENINFTQSDLNGLFKHCTDIGVSDLHIEGGQYLMAEIQGVLYPVSIKKISKNEASSLLKKMYDQNAMTRIGSVEAIDTGYNMKMDEELYRFRVNAVGSTVGDDKTVQITVRTLPDMPPEILIIEKGESLDAPKGFIALERDIWNNFCPESGLVIVTGPTGSGKSTLLASAIRKIAETPNVNKKIITYEAPIEFVYNKCKTGSCFISQTEVYTQLKSFQAAIESAMRRAPDIILIGEARDPETIDSAILASKTGHLVYTTAHNNKPSETMSRLINVFPEGERLAKMFDLLDTTRMIISQKLIKTNNGKLCAIKEYLIIDKEVQKILKNVGILDVAKKIDEIISDRRCRYIDDLYSRFLEGRISEKDFEDYEKEYGFLHKPVNSIFDISEEIKYLTSLDFIKETFKSRIHTGVVLDKKNIQYGKICFIDEKEMSKEEFQKKSNCFFSDIYDPFILTNKEIIKDLELKCNV